MYYQQGRDMLLIYSTVINSCNQWKFKPSFYSDISRDITDWEYVLQLGELSVRPWG